MIQALAFDTDIEKAMEAGEAGFRALMDKSQSIAWMKDEEGHYLYVNEPFERIFDVRFADICGKTDFDCFSEETARHVWKNDQLVLSTGHPLRLIEDTPAADGHVHTWLAVKFPFQVEGGRRLVGGVAVDITELKAFEVQLAERLRKANELNSELTRANAQLMKLATTDGLTGLKNYRHFRESLESAFYLAVRQGRTLTVAMLDVDEFKAYNDTFGHQSGDEVLCTISTILQTTVRGHDLVARYGGEEFLVLLPNTGLSASCVAAERLRVAVERYDWRLRPVTVSIGVASMTEVTCDPAELVRQADGALYRSKRSGRNRVTHS
jgi:diguanylate cyclase (GGDEF)-like protein/PAS domain S-box-containing protein